MRQHEIISVFYQHQPTYNPQMHKDRQPAKFDKKMSGAVKDSDCYGKNYDFESHIMPDSLSFPRSIIKQRTVLCNDKEHVHPTQKPVDLIAYLVRTYTNEGDIVLDNCMGSGTTAIACIREKRHYIGFELNKEYYDKAVERIKAEQSQPTLF
jgi:site-specific DNA-methyltransferase (adenine-specific)